MAISGEDRTMKGFFDSLLRSAADLEVSKAVKAQGQQVLSTVQKHVSDVLGEVEEVFDFAKRSFQNMVQFFKGVFTDLGDIFKGIFFNTFRKSVKSADDFYQKQVKAQTDTKDAVDGMLKGDSVLNEQLQAQRETTEAVKEMFSPERMQAFYDDQLRVQQQTLEATDSISRAFDENFRKLLDDMDTANKISGEELKRDRKDRLRALRGTKEKKKGGGILGFFGNILKGVFSGIGGLIGKYILPLLLVIGGIMGLAGLMDFKKIFGESAGLREAIEAAVGGLIAGIFKLPAMAVDWLMKKLFGVETNFAAFFTTENIAKKLHALTTWIDDNIITPIQDFFNSENWQWMKDEFWNSIDAIKMMWEGVVKVFNDTLEFWSKKLEDFKNLLFKETKQEEDYRTKELTQGAPINVGLGEGDIGLSYSKKEGEDIMALGATAAERRANLAAQQEQRNAEARQQHAELLQKLDQVIAASELFTVDKSMTQTTNLFNTKGGAGGNVPPGREPKEQVAGVQGNSGLP